MDSGQLTALTHIMVAADESEASRNAVRTGLGWAGKAGARATILSVGQPVPLPAVAGVSGDPAFPAERPEALASIERWLRRELAAHPGWPEPALVTAQGIPSVEIARAAEDSRADLLVLGRKERSPAVRLLVGDTADAVARRSRVPCLFIPTPSAVPARLLVALDGSERGLRVLHAARRVASALDAAIDLVTVERVRSDEPSYLARSVPAARTAKLATTLDGQPAPLRVRRGDIVNEILAEIQAAGTEVLVVGYHRGGPPGVLEAGSVARRLAHLAPCAVLTVPL
jgi:nucleotide-binding universal stress UspA family protein